MFLLRGLKRAQARGWQWLWSWSQLDSFAGRSKAAQPENTPFSQKQTKMLLMNQAITNPAQDLLSAEQAAALPRNSHLKPVRFLTPGSQNQSPAQHGPRAQWDSAQTPAPPSLARMGLSPLPCPSSTQGHHFSQTISLEF